MTERDFRGNLVVITGGSTGIGREIALGFLNRQDSVVVIDREPAAIDLTNLGAQTVLHDFALSPMVPRLKELISKLIDSKSITGLVLINNVSVRHRAEGGLESLATFQESLRVGLESAFWLASELVQIAARANVSFGVCSISSVLARSVGRETVSYAIVKRGLEALSETLCVRQKELGIPIRAFSVAPGFIVQDRDLTRFLDENNEEFRRTALSLHPDGSHGTAKDVAEVVTWLICDSPDFLNGQTVTLDGGLSLQDLFLAAERLDLL